MKKKFQIKSSETIISCKTSDSATNLIAQRIQWLTENFLVKMFDAGWDGVLYQDPKDKRFWEKIYVITQDISALTLKVISQEDARMKYTIELIKSDETEIYYGDLPTQSMWKQILEGGGVPTIYIWRVTSSRIFRLTENYLQKIIDNGWERLYIDPADNRLWELIYPKSEMHGGGPPLLRNIDRDMAISKYGII